MDLVASARQGEPLRPVHKDRSVVKRRIANPQNCEGNGASTTYRQSVRFRRFTRRRLRLLGLLALAVAVTAPATALAHDDEHESGQHHRSADLSVGLSGTPDPVQGGATATFTLTVTNAGPQAARRVKVAIVLTGPSEITQSDGAGWSCEIAGATAECTRRWLRPDTSSSIAFRAVAPPGFGRIGAGAAVTSRTDDPSRADNSAGIQIDVNNPPVVNADVATTITGSRVDIPVLANDVDPDGDQMTLTGTSAPQQGGTVTCGDGACEYTPRTGFTGVDTFTYTVGDGRGAGGSAEVTVTVTPAPPPPPPPDPTPDPKPDPKPIPTDDSGTSGPGVSIKGSATVTEGQTAPFTVTVVNNCTVVAKRVLLRLTLPVGTKVISAPSRSVLKGRTLTVPIGSVRKGTPRHVGVRLRFRDRGGSLRTLVAAVTSSNGRLAGDGVLISVRPR